MYPVFVALIYLAHRGLVYLLPNHWINLGSATSLLLLFTLFVGKIERKELAGLPVVGRFFKQPSRPQK